MSALDNYSAGLADCNQAITLNPNEIAYIDAAKVIWRGARDRPS
jgi:hypothetical protein